MMRCLVTGASGHVGSFVVRRLLDRGHDVTVLVRATSDLWRLDGVLDRVTVIRGEFAEVDRLAPLIAAAAPETVFHLAWQGVTRGERDSEAQIQANTRATLDLFELLRNGSSVRCWIGLGSQAEYGRCDQPLDEAMPPAPISAYGVAKVAASLLAREICRLRGIRFVWLRLLAAYGPMDDPRHLIPAVITSLLERETPRLTPGEQLWDYLHVQDAADGIVAAAESEKAAGVFNLASGSARPVRDIVSAVRDLIDRDLPIDFGAVPYGAEQPMLLQGNIERLQHATGWAPSISIEAGLQETVTWYSAERQHSRRKQHESV